MTNDERVRPTNLRHTLNEKIDHQTTSASQLQRQDDMRGLQVVEILVPVLYAIIGFLSYLWGQTFIVEEGHPY